MIVVLSVVVGALALGLLFQPLFGTKEDFFDCIRYWLKPDILSWFQGEHLEDCWAELKLFLWLGGGFLSGFAVHAALQ